VQESNQVLEPYLFQLLTSQSWQQTRGPQQMEAHSGVVVLKHAHIVVPNGKVRLGVDLVSVVGSWVLKVVTQRRSQQRKYLNGRQQAATEKSRANASTRC
jgi:hypothetical protein